MAENAVPQPPGVPAKCPQCKSTVLTRTVGGMTYDEKGWYQAVTVRCSNGHETTERFRHVQRTDLSAPSRLF